MPRYGKPPKGERRRQEPFWMNARYAGRCAGCQREFFKGALIFFYPSLTPKHKGAAFGGACGCGDRQEAMYRRNAQEWLNL